MKKINYLWRAIAFVSIVGNLQAQDIITKRTGEDLEAKVIEVGIDEIKYKKYNNQEGPVYSFDKAEILMIRYQNGSKEIFKKINNNNNPTTLGIVDYAEKGREDALKYYKGYKGAGTGAFFGGLIGGPIIGLIPAVATSSVKPRERNLNYPNADLMKNQEYYLAYTYKAKKIKQGRVWMNYGISSGINITLSIAAAVIISLTNNY